MAGRTMVRSQQRVGNEQGRGGQAPCMTGHRDIIRSYVIGAVSRGEKPDVIVKNVLEIAKNEGDPSATKAAIFQLLDKLGKLRLGGGLNRESFRSIADAASSIFPLIPKTAQENMLRLFNDVAEIHSFGTVSFDRDSSAFRLTGPSFDLAVASAISGTPGNVSIFVEARDNLLKNSGDLSSFVQARETIFKVYDETRDNRHLRKALRQWAGRSEDADPVTAPIRSETAFAPALLVPPAPALGNVVSDERRPSQRTEDAMPNYMPARGDSGFRPSISPMPAQEPQVYQAPLPRQAETKGRARPDASVYRAVVASGASGRSQTGNAKGNPDYRTLGAGIPVNSRDIRLLLASSEKGEQLVQSLMEKLRSHGRDKQREQGKPEESGESQDIENAVAGIKEKVSEGKGGKKGGKSGKKAKPQKKKAEKAASEPRAGKSRNSKGRKADKQARQKALEKPKPAKERKPKSASEKRKPATSAKSGKAKRASRETGKSLSKKEKPKTKRAILAKESKKRAVRSLLLKRVLPKARKK